MSRLYHASRWYFKKTLVIDLIGQLSRYGIGLCQLSRDVIGYEDS